MRPLPVDYHQFLAEIEELHGHGVLYRGGPDGDQFVCRHEDCDGVIDHAEILRGGINYRSKRDPRQAEAEIRRKNKQAKKDAAAKLAAKRAAELEAVAAWQARNDGKLNS